VLVAATRGWPMVIHTGKAPGAMAVIVEAHLLLRLGVVAVADVHVVARSRRETARSQGLHARATGWGCELRINGAVWGSQVARTVEPGGGKTRKRFSPWRPSRRTPRPWGNHPGVGVPEGDRAGHRRPRPGRVD